MDEREEKKTKSSRGGLLDKIVPVLLIASIGMAFMVGVLWQKVNNLEGGKGSPTAVNVSGTPAQKPSALRVEALKTYAKELKLDTSKFNKCLDDSQTAQKVNDQVKKANDNGVQGTPGFIVNNKIFLAGAFPYEIFKQVLDYELGGGNWQKPSADIQKYIDSGGIQIVDKKVDTSGLPMKGEGNAKLTIVEFSDFQCPYCSRFYGQTYGEIVKNYIDTGKVKLYFNQLPLTQLHPDAQKAAEASLCANEQGKFWEMHDKLFNAVLGN